MADNDAPIGLTLTEATYKQNDGAEVIYQRGTDGEPMWFYRRKLDRYSTRAASLDAAVLAIKVPRG
jgi:hypothetical protein